VRRGAAQATPPVVIATILREKGVTGVHTHFRQFLRYLQRREWPVDLVTPFSLGRPVVAPVFGLRVLLQRVNGPANVWWYRHWHEVALRLSLRRRLADLDECVVYAQCPLAARAALRARRGPQQRVVLAVHFRISQADEWVDKGEIARDDAVFRWVRSVERDVLPRVDGIVFVSAWAQKALLEWLPEAATVPSAVIGNFVDPLPTTPLREELGDLVTVGNLEAIKNHRYLLEILRKCRDAGRVYTLDIFGEGPQRKDLEELIRSYGLEQQVRMHGFRTDVRDRLPRYRAYVHASYSESLPLAIIEALAAGLPVVAGDAGGIPELFDEGVEGRFWPLDDPARAASVLVDLLDDEPTRERTARAGLERFRRDFDADVIAPRLLSFVTGR